MENTQQVENKKPASSRDYAMLGFGILMMATACIFFAGSVMLDISGEKAIGKLSNASVGHCPANETCWTGRIDFTAKDGEKITFYPLTFPMLLDFDPFLSGRSYEQYGNYEVRYSKNYPQIAKVKLAFFLEYVNMVCGLCGGVLLLILSYLFSSFGKSHKPMVIDLSNLRKGN